MRERISERCSCLALRQAARHVSRLYDDALVTSGLTLNQFSILSKLNHLGACNLKQLAEALVMDRSTLGRLLAPLTARALLKTETQSADRRQRQMMLTPAGHEVLEQAHHLWQQAEQRFVKSFGPSEAKALRITLKRITQMAWSEH